MPASCAWMAASLAPRMDLDDTPTLDGAREILRRTLDGEDAFAAERKRMRDILFTHQDAGSSARVCKHIEILLGLNS